MADDDARDLALLDRAAAHFGAVLDQVRPEQLGAPTPCSEWNVEALLQHVIGGNNWAMMLLNRVAADDAMTFARQTSFSGDLAADYRGGVTGMRSAFEAEGALAKTVYHPAGMMTGRQFLRMRASDLTIHSWDLARAVGADETLPDDLVRAALELLEPMAARIPQLGVFGPGPEGAPEPSSPQQHLLQLSGRRP